MPKISALGGMSSRGFGEFAQQTAANYIEDVFSTYLYSGSSSDVTINNSIDLLTKGGMVWVKNRTNASGSSAYSGTEGSNMLFDTERGMTLTGFSRGLRSNGTNAQTNFSTGGIGANTNGFTAGYNGFMDINLSGNIYASWTFRKQPKFFDVVTYTGDGVSGRTVSHNLGSTPGFIITKRTDAATNWLCYHTSLGFGAGTYTDTNYIVLNSSSASNGFGTAGVIVSANSTTFSPGASANFNGGTYVAYLFANNAGGFGADGSQNVISCGSFTCDASGNIGTVSLGYEPQFILLKRTDTTQNWYIFDVMRGMSFSLQNGLSPNLSGTELSFSGTPYLYPTATGFAGTGNFFGPNAQVIYMAIRRGPMRTPTSGTSVFTPIAQGTGTNGLPSFPSDAVITQQRSGGIDWQVGDRLRGFLAKYSAWVTGTTTASAWLATNNTNAESTTGAKFGTPPDSVLPFVDNNNMPALVPNGQTNAIYFFKRAPGFFDVVCYTGTGVARTINHNLGVVPEMMIVKPRSNGGTALRGWSVYVSSLGNGNALLLQTTDYSQGSSFWNYTTPTSTVFSVDGTYPVNEAGTTYVAYLFASCPGVSKVGSYTGTGATQTINCGFTGGARFVMIKRTDSGSPPSGWYTFDTARGMVAGTDPYLLLNSTAAETNANNVYTATGGFQIVSSDSGVNANGASYIYLAIA